MAVLSAEHGILEPGTKITPYEKQMTEDRLVAIANDQHQIDKLTKILHGTAAGVKMQVENGQCEALDTRSTLESSIWFDPPPE